MTTVEITYEWGCRYDIPTAIPRNGSALHHSATIDTLSLLVDSQYDRECPKREAGRD